MCYKQLINSFSEQSYALLDIQIYFMNLKANINKLCLKYSMRSLYLIPFNFEVLLFVSYCHYNYSFLLELEILHAPVTVSAKWSPFTNRDFTLKKFFQWSEIDRDNPFPTYRKRLVFSSLFHAFFLLCSAFASFLCLILPSLYLFQFTISSFGAFPNT